MSKSRNWYYCRDCNNVAKSGHRHLEDDIDAITARISTGKNGCWNWNGSTDHGGYGTFTFAGRHWLFHRFTYLVYNGSLPDEGYVIHHECENTLCGNPEHLRAMYKLMHTALHAELRIIRGIKQEKPEQSGSRIWAELILNTWSRDVTYER